MYDTRQEHVCLFEKIPFEIYVCKKKELSIKLPSYKNERNLTLCSTTEEYTRIESLNVKSQSSSSLDPSVVV